jgi:uncharacterized protein (DUF433 family)
MPNLQPSFSNAGADFNALVGDYDEVTAIAIQAAMDEQDDA